MFAYTEHSEATPMHAFTTEATRRSSIGAARWSQSRRRRYFRLRNFAQALPAAMSGLLKALHDSRSLLATRVITEHRHLVGDYRCMGVLYCADDAELEAQQTKLTEQ
jgi:hypothetical protein